MFREVKKCNPSPPAGFELMTYKFIVNPLTHCVTMFVDTIRKEANYIITLDFIVYLDNQYQYKMQFI